ncbi:MULTISPECIES: hypothetical protein [Planktothrix]|uniref:hypothetical protein n=1 Tax=Planktothrix TaxID=54304 RepID=UPI000427979D|nr:MULTISPECIES: hypothetical protein [Planktothrix]
MLQPDSGSGFTLKGREFSPGLPRGFPLPFTVLEVIESDTPARIFIQGVEKFCDRCYNQK